MINTELGVNISHKTFKCVSIAVYFLRVLQYVGGPVVRVKIQTTSINVQRYCKLKRLIRDFLSNVFYSQNAHFPPNFNHLRGQAGIRNLLHRLYGVQITDICSRFARELYSTKPELDNNYSY